MSGWLLLIMLIMFILVVLVVPTQKLDSSSDLDLYTFDVDDTLHLKPIHGIPAPLWPQDQTFSDTHP